MVKFTLPAFGCVAPESNLESALEHATAPFISPLLSPPCQLTPAHARSSRARADKAKRSQANCFVQVPSPLSLAPCPPQYFSPRKLFRPGCACARRALAALKILTTPPHLLDFMRQRALRRAAASRGFPAFRPSPRSARASRGTLYATNPLCWDLATADLATARTATEKTRRYPRLAFSPSLLPSPQRTAQPPETPLSIDRASPSAFPGHSGHQGHFGHSGHFATRASGIGHLGHPAHHATSATAATSATSATGPRPPRDRPPRPCS